MPKIRIRPPIGQPLCSVEEKAKIVAEIRRRHEREERSILQLAREYGISGASYYNWSKQFSSAPLMRPVEVMPATCLPVQVLGVLVSPRGYRVEGLAVTDLAQLLRLLA